MLQTRRQFSLGLILPLLSIGALGLAGCAEDKDKTGPGEGGLGAPGAPPAGPVLSEEEAYAEQQKREAELAKESQ